MPRPEDAKDLSIPTTPEALVKAVLTPVSKEPRPQTT